MRFAANKIVRAPARSPALARPPAANNIVRAPVRLSAPPARLPAAASGPKAVRALLGGLLRSGPVILGVGLAAAVELLALRPANQGESRWLATRRADQFVANLSRGQRVAQALSRGGLSAGLFIRDISDATLQTARTQLEAAIARRDRTAARQHFGTIAKAMAFHARATNAGFAALDREIRQLKNAMPPRQPSLSRPKPSGARDSGHWSQVTQRDLKAGRPLHAAVTSPPARLPALGTPSPPAHRRSSLPDRQALVTHTGRVGTPEQIATRQLEATARDLREAAAIYHRRKKTLLAGGDAAALAKEVYDGTHLRMFGVSLAQFEASLAGKYQVGHSETGAGAPGGPAAAPTSAGPVSESHLGTANRLLSEHDVPRLVDPAGITYEVASGMQMAMKPTSSGSSEDSAARLILPATNNEESWILKPQEPRTTQEYPPGYGTGKNSQIIIPATPPGYESSETSSLTLPRTGPASVPRQPIQISAAANQNPIEQLDNFLHALLSRERGNPARRAIEEFLQRIADRTPPQRIGVYYGQTSRRSLFNLVPSREIILKNNNEDSHDIRRLALGEFSLDPESLRQLESLIISSIKSSASSLPGPLKIFALRFLTNTVYIKNFEPASVNIAAIEALKQTPDPAARTIYEHYLSTQLHRLEPGQKLQIIKTLQKCERLSSHLAQSIFTEMPRLREGHSSAPFPAIDNLKNLEDLFGALSTYLHRAMNQVTLVPAQLAPEARFGAEIEMQLRGLNQTRGPDTSIQRALSPYEDQIELGIDFDGRISELRTKGGLSISQMQALLFPVVNIFHRNPDLVLFGSNHVHVDLASADRLSLIKFFRSYAGETKKDTLELQPPHVNTQRLSLEDELPYSYNASLLIDYMLVAEALKSQKLSVEATRMSYHLAKKYGLDVLTTQLFLVAVENGKGYVIPNILRLYAHGKSQFPDFWSSRYKDINNISSWPAEEAEYFLNTVPAERLHDFIGPIWGFVRQNRSIQGAGNLVARRIFLPDNSKFSREFYKALDEVTYTEVSKIDFVIRNLLDPPQDITSSGILKDAVDLAALTVVRRVDPYSEVSVQPISLAHASQLLESALVPTSPAASNASAQEQWQGLNPTRKREIIGIAQDYLRGLVLKYGRMAQESPVYYPYNLRDRARARAANDTEISEFEAVSGELENWLRESISYPATQDTHAIAREALAVALASTTPNFVAKRRYEADAALVRMPPEEREGLLTRVAFQVGGEVAPLTDLVTPPASE